jgi:anaerobic selenocysteine-containing dehydrogenase
VRGFQSVLLDLGARLGLPGMVHADGRRDIAITPTTSCATNGNPASACSRLARRGRQREGKGAPNVDQLQRYIEARRVLARPIPGVRALLQDGESRLPAVGAALRASSRTPSRSCCSCIRRRCRSSASRRRATARRKPPDRHRTRVATYFDPLPIWYEPFEHDETSREDFPLSAITQRPMYMYHAWGSQNAWLRQIQTRNALYVHPDTGAKYGLQQDDWAEVDSHNGTITVQVRFRVERAARHGVELERDRQAPRRMAPGQGCARKAPRASCSTI